MSRYVGEYQSISRVWSNIDLTTSYIETNPFVRRIATPTQDLLLPPTFLTYVKEGNYGCPISMQNTRTARLYTSTTTYLEIVIPWTEGSPSFISFFQEVESVNGVVETRYLGETINYNALVWHSNQP